MGLAIEREQFNQANYLGFQRRLEKCLLALARLLRRPSFGTGPITVGAELELFLVDDQGRALPLNQAVRAETADPRGGPGGRPLQPRAEPDPGAAGRPAVRGHGR